MCDEEFHEGDHVMFEHCGGRVIRGLILDVNDDGTYIVKDEDTMELYARISGDALFLARDGMDDYKVGDRVYAPFYGYGTVTAIHNGCMYPIIVTWDEGKNKNIDFTRDGYALMCAQDPRIKITLVDTDLKEIDDAINPSHYKVEGLPEAIDIINHLMHREQYEGFLWGNILKYAYRFGRKGDKAETAGKIAWYATRLKELEEEKRK